MIPLQDFQKRPRVLVAGEGLTALEAASRVLDLGYEVLLACPAGALQPTKSLPAADQELSGYEQELQDHLRSHPQSRFRTGARVRAIQGFAGDFQVALDTGAGLTTEAVGAIVLAPELQSDETVSPLQTGEDPSTITLKGMVEALLAPAEESASFRSLGPASYVAMVVGLNGCGNTADMAQALTGALKIKEQFAAQVYFFTGQMKVAEEGLERLYLACRDAGVIFFKFEENQPEFVIQKGQRVIQFVDPLVGLPLELSPDLLITDAVHLLPNEIQTLAAEAHLGLDRCGLLQPANVHLLPHQTLREGIFVAGPIRQGPLLPAQELAEARGAALAVQHFFQGRETELRDREVTVDKGLCTVCLTCLRFCPHQAIGWTHRVFIHPLACRRCGICASECPMDAIQIQGYGDTEVENRLAEISARWEQEGIPAPRIVIFGCQRSAGVAWEEALSAERGAPGVIEHQSAVEFIGLPCAGKLDTDVLLKALTAGGDGVLVLACPEENCRSLQGNSYARRRLEEAREYLEEAGMDPERFRFATLSSNMVHKLLEIIDRFSEDIKENRKEPGFPMGVME
jgi:coenzyme F420-reducing hydrogenase delta subunit/Pyruvate/2-oxoacid:ferredoxin oxidoreductase delta subunit